MSPTQGNILLLVPAQRGEEVLGVEILPVFIDDKEVGVAQCHRQYAHERAVAVITVMIGALISWRSQWRQPYLVPS